MSKIIQFTGLLFLLSSCGVYSKSFNCPDSRGARCVMLSHVDQMIDSGEIETIYQNKKKCKNGICTSEIERPKRRLTKTHTITIEEGREPAEWQEDNKLFIK